MINVSQSFGLTDSPDRDTGSRAGAVTPQCLLTMYGIIEL
jgi:hypothetical protein